MMYGLLDGYDWNHPAHTGILLQIIRMYQIPQSLEIDAGF